MTRGAAVAEEALLSSALTSAISPETEIPRSSAGAAEMLMLTEEGIIPGIRFLSHEKKGYVRFVPRPTSC
jgi:hypothetical protein